MGEEKKTYSTYLECTNCGYYKSYKIPKGTEVKDFIKGKNDACKDCGCVGLKKEEDM